MPQTKEERKEYHKIWYQKNREEQIRKQSEYNERTKDERALVYKIWYQNNREEQSRKQSEYYARTKEARLAKCKEYRQDNKEQIALKNKKWYQNNKEEINRKQREYYENHKEAERQKSKEYRKTPNGKKKEIIGNWKQKGIKSDNYDILYDNYLSETHCDFCRIEFGKWGDGTGSYKCCDHDHTTGLFRNFLCNKCNLQRG